MSWGGRLVPWLAAAWVVLFCALFFAQRLANNPQVSRGELLSQTHWLLFDLIDPPAPTPHTTEEFVRAHSGWRYVPQRADLLLVMLLIVAGGWGLGQLVLRWLLPRALIASADAAEESPSQPLGSDAIAAAISRSAFTALDRHVFALGLGFAGISLVTLGLGLLGVMSAWGVGTLVVGCPLIEIGLRWRERQGRISCGGGCPPFAKGGLGGGGGRAAVPFVLAMLLGALLPSTDFDVNEYHFQGPKEYYQQGRISFLPHNVYTSFPFCTEMLTLAGIIVRQDWYWGALAGKGVLMVFALVTALGLFAMGRRWFGPVVGGCAAFLYLSTPWVYRISTIAYTEGGLACYLLLSLWALLLGREIWRRQAQTPQPDARLAHRFWLLAGLLAGSAMACKYPGLVSVVVPLGASIAGVIGTTGGSPSFAKGGLEMKRMRDVARGVAWYLLGVVITVGPWLVKNLIETGNPVYPLAYSIFGGRDWNGELDAKWRRGHSSTDFSIESLATSVLDIGLFNDWQSPLVVVFAPLALIPLGGRPLAWRLWGYVLWLWGTWWLLTHRIDRFWVPMLPVLTLLAAVGLVWQGTTVGSTGPLPESGETRSSGGARAAGVWSPAARGWRLVRTACVLLASAYHLAFITTGLCGYNQYLLDLNVARTMVTGIVSPSVAYLNEHLPAEAKVLCVGEAQVFDATFPLLYNTVFDASLFEEMCAANVPADVPPGQKPLASREVIRQRLRDQGITHVLVNWWEILRYRTTYGYTDFVSPRRFRDLQQLGVLGDAWPIPTAVQVDDPRHISPSYRDEIDTWGPELRLRVEGQPVVTTFQIFPVQD